MLVIAIFTVTAISTLPMISYFRERQTVSTLTTSIVQVLRLAQGKSLSRTNGTPWGVYINASRDTLTLFSGTTYEKRDPIFDQTLIIRRPFRICANGMTEDAPASIIFPVVPAVKNDLRFLELYSLDPQGDRSVIHVNLNGVVTVDQDPESVCH